MFPEKLTTGYRSFLDGRLSDEAKRYAALAKGQNPEVLLIGCCDSRVSPEVIFDTGPGELFIIRNVANLVPPFEEGGEYHGTSAAIEFAVQALEVKHIVVLGHATCGGIKAYANPPGPLSTSDFIGKWVSLVKGAEEKLQGSEGAGSPDPPRIRDRGSEPRESADVPLRPRAGRRRPPGAPWRAFRHRSWRASPAQSRDRGISSPPSMVGGSR